MLHKLGTEWEVISSDNKIQIWLDEKDGVKFFLYLEKDDEEENIIPVVLSSTFFDKKYLIRKKVSNESS